MQSVVNLLDCLSNAHQSWQAKPCTFSFSVNGKNYLTAQSRQRETGEMSSMTFQSGISQPSNNVCLKDIAGYLLALYQSEIKQLLTCEVTLHSIFHDIFQSIEKLIAIKQLKLLLLQNTKVQTNPKRKTTINLSLL